jgi:hypothetical protein
MWLLLLVAGVASFAQEEVLSEGRDGGYWSKRVLVPEERFTVPEVEAMARRFVSEAGKGLVVAQLSVYTSGEEAAMDVDSNRNSYITWKAYYDWVAQRPLRMAQVTAIRGNAVLRIRLADGTVVRRVLSGKDPLHIESDGLDFEILVLGFRSASWIDRCQPDGAMSPSGVYLMADAPLTANACDRVTARLGELLGTKILWAAFRNDHWFISFGSYPLIYQFATPSEPPSETEYYSSIAYHCLIWCDKQGPCSQVLPDVPPPRRRGRDNK